MYNEDLFAASPESPDSYPDPGSPRLGVSEFLNFCNQTLALSYENVQIVGEVASFKVNQGKWVFFDLKDADSSISCFLPLWELRMPLEDGMKVIVSGFPKITKWGKFSFTVRRVMPLGEGSLKKSLELLKQKLAKEGLFDPAKKRPLPDPIRSIGVISSTQAAGYADFIKIINARWGGLHIEVAHTQVQGLDAADQIIRALRYFNEKAELDAIAILRGGGSQDDLSTFNDEQLVRAIAASRIPVITGIGHEVDESLADLAADLRASTPSNAAELLTPDRQATRRAVKSQIASLASHLKSEISALETRTRQITPLGDFLLTQISQTHQANLGQVEHLAHGYVVKITTLIEQNRSTQKILEALNPEKVLRQGYAILSGKISPGERLEITTVNNIIETEIINVQKR